MKDDPRIAELLDRWEDLLEQQQHISPEELCRECPELVDELRRRIDRLQWVGELLDTGPLEGVASSDSFRFPPMLGRYRLEERIGEGGFGQVWKGYDPELDRIVAIKILRPEQHTSVFQVARFLEEAKKVAKLRHSNIVTVYDAGRDQGFCFIVTELIEGQDLASRMKSGRVAWPEAISITAKVADALHSAFKRGFIHRDVKPHNILLDENNEPFITDFGIAIAADALSEENSDASGTVSYMSPEQANIGGPPIDHRSDVFSLGVVLYELLTGRLPHTARTLKMLREQLQTGRVLSPRSVDSSIPIDLDQVCMKALAFEPSERWSTAEEFANALRKCQQTEYSHLPTFRIVLIVLAVLAVATAILFARMRRASDSSDPPQELLSQIPGATIPETDRSISELQPAEVLPRWVFEGHTGEITSCLVSADNHYVISTATNNDGVFIWDVESGEQILELDHICRYAFFSDKNTIVTLGAAVIQTVKTWEFPSGKELGSVSFSGCFWRASLATNAKNIAYTTRSTVVLFDLMNQKDLLAFPRAESVPYGVAISQDGMLAVTGEQSGDVQLWNAQTGELLRTLLRHNNYVQSVAFSPDSRLVLSAGWDNTARLFDRQQDQQTRKHEFRLAYACAFSPDGRRYAVAGDGIIEVFNTETGDAVSRLAGHGGKLVTYVSFSSDGEQLVSGGRDFSICLWRLDE